MNIFKQFSSPCKQNESICLVSKSDHGAACCWVAKQHIHESEREKEEVSAQWSEKFEAMKADSRVETEIAGDLVLVAASGILANTLAIYRIRNGSSSFAPAFCSVAAGPTSWWR